MFSQKEKQFIATEVEKIILSLNHPEMPTEHPKFLLNIEGKEPWSFATIQPNHTFDDQNKPGINAWNENAREILGDKP